MENTLEAKAKFFAQYWGQKVLGNTQLKSNIPLAEVGVMNCKGLPQQYLQLNHELTPQDKEIVDKISYEESGCFEEKSLKVTDYIRSKGYALPWMGLSVETLESYGWIKLKSE